MKKWVILSVLLVIAFSASAADYTALHDALIRFYGYQRAGLKSGTSGNLNNMNEHKGDNYNNNPLDGGWYDAGDYIKFGMPLSYAVYCLLKGYDIFPSAYADNYKADNSSGTDGIPDILNQVKYATDYLMKAVINESTIILDVGIASEEHRSMSVVNGAGRDASKCGLCTGADIPATYAACLALMSTVYKKYDSTYSKQCLDKAIVAFKFAKKKIDQGGVNNLYSQAQQKDGAYLYYYYQPDGGELQRQIGDKMAAAGVELYRASNDADPIYKTWAKATISEMYNCMSYSFVGPLASFEVWRQGLGGASSVFENVGFVEKMVQTTGVFKGVYKNSGWGTARDVGTASFVYALGYVTNSTETARASYLQRAKDHIAWVTGTNSLSKSFIVGVGGSSPTSIHYRPTSSGPKGGVVSGPDGDGNWANDGSAKYCEVAIDYNAAIIGGVAFLKAIDNPGDDIQIKTAFTATPSGEVDLTAKSVNFSAGFSKSTAWTLTITGGAGTKSYTGTGTSVTATWDGSADQGIFLSGENVAARLTVDGNIVAYDILKAKALNFFLSKVKKPVANPADVLIDDFEDSDTLNKLTGKWVPFGNQTSFSGKTTLRFGSQDNSIALQAVCNVTSNARTTYAGAKATFNATGTPGTLGGAKTIVFDLKANKETRVCVELEQPGIADSAYYGMTVPVTTSSNTYRLDIAKFTQPDWKTVEKPLDLNAISGLRFTVYDSTGIVTLSIDNVAIEGFSTATVVNATHQSPASIVPAISNSGLMYTFPQSMKSSFECAIYDISGKIVMRKTINAAAGSTVTIPLSHLSSGVYTIRHSVAGIPAGKKMLFTRVK
jgi:endoglucanase